MTDNSTTNDFYAVENTVRKGGYPGWVVSTHASHWDAVAETIRLATHPPPYPFCRTPGKCAGKGYCPRDIACND
jgi:hypothetical protein